MRNHIQYVFLILKSEIIRTKNTHQNLSGPFEDQKNFIFLSCILLISFRLILYPYYIGNEQHDQINQPDIRKSKVKHTFAYFHRVIENEIESGMKISYRFKSVFLFKFYLCFLA